MEFASVNQDSRKSMETVYLQMNVHMFYLFIMNLLVKLLEFLRFLNARSSNTPTKHHAPQFHRPVTAAMDLKNALLRLFLAAMANVTVL